ncbi:zinc finger, CCHC-type containing protein [Tanacetum coccineum]
MADENPIRTLGDYSKPSHEGYRNTIELPVGNNVGKTRIVYFNFLYAIKLAIGLNAFQQDPSSTWEDLTTLFLAQFFPPRRTAKLRNDILMFQQHHGESLSEAWTRFKDLLQKVPHHGIDRWLQIQIFYDHVSFHLKCEIELRNDILMFQQHHGESLSEAWTRFKDLLRKVPHHGIDIWLKVQIFYDRIDQTLKRTVDYAAEGRLRKLKPEEAWATIEKLAQYEDEGWNDTVAPGEGSLNYENPNIEQLLGIMERKVDTLMKDAISLMGSGKGIFRLTTNKMCQPPTVPSRQEEFEHIVMNFIYDQEERIKQLKNYMQDITNEFMELSSEVTLRLKERIKENESKPQKIKKNHRSVEPLEETPLEDLGLNTCYHEIPLSFKEIPNLDEPKRQPQLFPSFPSLEVDLGEERDPKPPIKPPSLDSFKMKIVDPLTIHTPPSPHVASFRPKDISCYYHPCVDDPKRHYGFKPGLLGQNGSLSVDLSNLEVIFDEKKLGSS